MTRIAFPFAGLVLLAGCAATTPMTPGPDHPADPDAPTSAAPEPSTVLALTPAPTTSPAPTRPKPTTQSAVTYTCPHHPEVVSSEPGKCPKCDMKLVRKEGGDGHAH